MTLTLRAVQPRTTGEGRTARLTYQQADASAAGVVVGDVVIAVIGFGGPNLLLDGGLTAKREPLGILACEVKPWTGGSTLVRQRPYPCPQAALRCVDGVLANQESAWTKEARGTGVNHAEGRVRFKKPQTLTSIAIYEDNDGPLPSGNGVRERTSMRYGVYVRNAATRELLHVGHAVDNTQLVNVFECPPVAVDEILYFWAGRHDAGKTDGVVRMAELEAYADEMTILLDDDDVLGGDDDDALDLEW